MTRDEALKLDAGPELDAVVAEVVMGFKIVEGWPHHIPGITPSPGKYLTAPEGRPLKGWWRDDGSFTWNASATGCNYSTDIAAAFQIWPMLYKRWGSVALCQYPDGIWTCMDHDGIGATYGYGPTECVALCRAGIAEFFDRRD
jgi:hypothetical protein